MRGRAADRLKVVIVGAGMGPLRATRLRGPCANWGIDPAVDFHSIIPSRGRRRATGIVPARLPTLRVPRRSFSSARGTLPRGTGSHPGDGPHPRRAHQVVRQGLIATLRSAWPKPRGESWAKGQSGSETPATEGIP